MKTPVILRIFKDSQLVEVKQFDGDQIIIGHSENVQVDLNDPAVSPIHCLIELRDSGYYICDLGSQSGTLRNGIAVLDEPLSSGDSIVVGPFSLQFFVGVPKPKAPPGLVVLAAPTVPVAPVVPVAPAALISNVAPTVAKVPSTASVPSAPSTSPMSSVPLKSAAPVPPRLPDKPAKAVTKSHATGEEVTKGSRTFAPPSEIQDLRDYLKPTKGNTLEVIVAWRERVLQTYTFSGLKKTLTSGPKNADIFIPSQFQSSSFPLVNLTQGQAQIAVPGGVTIESVTTAQRFSLDDLMRMGKANSSGAGHSVRMEQGDLVCLSFDDGTLQIFIRFVPAAPVPVIASLLDMSGPELTGMIVAGVIVSLIWLYMSVYTPSPQEDQKPDEKIYVAEMVFNKPPAVPTPTPTPIPPAPPVVQATPVPTPTPEIKKIKVTDEKPKQKPAAVKTPTTAVAERPAAKAADVRPNPTKLDRPKKFTSIKQGGAVKMGETASANANSTKDVTKTGLLSAFGGGGARKQLDQAYTGSGELLGMADKATGTSGQNEDRAGDDIGSKFKDSGAGGKGTATQGISGLNTKGRASGNSAYGGVGGFGGKGNVAIDAGGAGEEFVGTIDKEAVRRVIRSILSQIKSCYERQLRVKTGLEGKVIVTFEIEEQGRVRVARTKTSSLNDSTVESCVASRIKEQRFPEPPPGTVAVVDYPFVFGAQK